MNPTTLPLVLLGLAMMFGADMYERHQLVNQEPLIRHRWEREHPGETFGQEPDWNAIAIESARIIGIGYDLETPNPGPVRLKVEDL